MAEVLKPFNAGATPGGGASGRNSLFAVSRVVDCIGASTKRTSHNNRLLTCESPAAYRVVPVLWDARLGVAVFRSKIPTSRCPLLHFVTGEMEVGTYVGGIRVTNKRGPVSRGMCIPARLRMTSCCPIPIPPQRKSLCTRGSIAFFFLFRKTVYIRHLCAPGPPLPTSNSCIKKHPGVFFVLCVVACVWACRWIIAKYRWYGFVGDDKRDPLLVSKALIHVRYIIHAYRKSPSELPPGGNGPRGETVFIADFLFNGEGSSVKRCTIG